MATKAAVDAAQATETAAITKLGADLSAVLTALENKIAAGSPDLQPEVDAAKAIATTLTNLDAQVEAANPTPPTTPGA